MATETIPKKEGYIPCPERPIKEPERNRIPENIPVIKPIPA